MRVERGITLRSHFGLRVETRHGSQMGAVVGLWVTHARHGETGLELLLERPLPDQLGPYRFADDPDIARFDRHSQAFATAVLETVLKEVETCP